jgi:Flp pilus assembly protein TadD
MAKDEELRAAALSDTEVHASLAPSDDRSGQSQPGPRAAEIENIFRRALNHLDRKELDRAARTFRSVLRLDPRHYEALTGLGRCLAEMGMREDARKCFEKALEIKPDYVQARVNLELNR